MLDTILGKRGTSRYQRRSEGDVRAHCKTVIPHFCRSGGSPGGPVAMLAPNRLEENRPLPPHPAPDPRTANLTQTRFAFLYRNACEEFV